MDWVVSRPLVLKVPLPLSVIALPAVTVNAPEVLLTAALSSTLLAAPVASRDTVPEPPAVTAAPMVSVPLAVRLILPLAAVPIGPVVVSVPVLLTTTLPFAAVLLMPEIVKAAVFVKAMLPATPTPALAALKTATVLAPLSVWPATELVVSVPVVDTRPPPLSVMLPATPVAVRFTAPPAVVDTLPVTLMAPALVTVSVPPPTLLMRATFSVPLLFSATLPPPVLVALKPVTVLALFSVVPPTELAVRVVPLMIAVGEVSAMVPLPLRLTVVLAVTEPASMIGVATVLLPVTVTEPLPEDTPARVVADVLVKITLPLAPALVSVTAKLTAPAPTLSRLTPPEAVLVAFTVLALTSRSVAALPMPVTAFRFTVAADMPVSAPAS